MMSILKRNGATAIASLLLAGSIALPTTAVAADPGLSIKPTTPARSVTLLPQYTDTFTVARDIRFGGGVPVGGWAALTLHSDGTYNWTGHVRDSGFPGYNFSGACVVRFRTGDAYIFDVRGSMGGAFGGSRDFNWQKPGHLNSLPTVWDRASGYTSNCSWRSSFDVGGAIQTAKDGIPYAMAVLAVVGA
ncbi:hypothetical protein ABZT03_36705 [Streptomyces sp. NPDC005574]|uniref:hypothetical protein n=1 Tax=Streptomyces sp. NPDC005574 TaxID=3156891 RepID=UPI0033A6836A